MKFIVGVHVSEGRAIVAVCDAEIHGKKYEDKKSVLDLGSRFYQGTEQSAEETEKLMKKAYIINAAGKNATALAVKLRLADEGSIKETAKIPNVQILMV